MEMRIGNVRALQSDICRHLAPWGDKKPGMRRRVFWFWRRGYVDGACRDNKGRVTRPMSGCFAAIGVRLAVCGTGGRTPPHAAAHGPHPLMG